MSGEVFKSSGGSGSDIAIAELTRIRYQDVALASEGPKLSSLSIDLR
jgi:hypothetical protein